MAGSTRRWQRGRSSQLLLCPISWGCQGAKGRDIQFFLKTDDGSILYVDGTKVVDNNGRHSHQTRQGTKSLTQSEHPIEVKFYEWKGGTDLVLEWKWADEGSSPSGLGQCQLLDKRWISVKAASASPTPTATSTKTATRTRTPTSSSSSTRSPTNTPTGTSTRSPTLSSSASRSKTSSPTPTLTPTSSFTATRTPSVSRSVTPTGTGTASSTQTPTSSPTNTLTPTCSGSSTSSVSSSLTGTPTVSPTPTRTASATVSVSPTNTRTVSGTVSVTSSTSGTATCSYTSSSTQSPTTTGSKTVTLSPTPSSSKSPSASLTSSFTVTPTNSASVSSSSSPVVSNFGDSLAKSDSAAFRNVATTLLPVLFLGALLSCFLLVAYKRQRNRKECRQSVDQSALYAATLGVPPKNFKFLSRDSVNKEMIGCMNPLASDLAKKAPSTCGGDLGGGGVRETSRMMVHCIDKNVGTMHLLPMSPDCPNAATREKGNGQVILVAQSEYVDDTYLNRWERAKLRYREWKSKLLGELPPLVEVKRSDVDDEHLDSKNNSIVYQMEVNPYVHQLNFTKKDREQVGKKLFPELGGSGRLRGSIRTEFSPSLSRGSNRGSMYTSIGHIGHERKRGSLRRGRRAEYVPTGAADEA
eukprot:gb/GECG01013615.1/.p1 GENE.gb/GECG01013615.1/~~gb/GECG01013615.1/.p1  ORF type:complete len:638 (+),score=66.22 gb/GECG01013615.1/:1-1914(+)